MTSFNEIIEKSIIDNWDLDALTDYKGITLQYHDVARKIEKLHIMFENSGVQRGDKIALCFRKSTASTGAMLSPRRALTSTKTIVLSFSRIKSISYFPIRQLRSRIVYPSFSKYSAAICSASWPHSRFSRPCSPFCSRLLIVDNKSDRHSYSKRRLCRSYKKCIILL